MTREQIEADIAQFERALANADNKRHTDPGLIAGIAAICRALARLRADLARLDGPAEGFRRVTLAVRYDRYGAIDEVAPVANRDEARRHWHDGRDSDAVIVVDLPILRAVEVEGTVVE